MVTKEERALASWNERYPVGSELYRDAQIDGYIAGATEQEAIYNKRMEELLQYLEELEAHYRVLGHYDDGKPIRRVIEFIKTMEK